MVTAQELIVAIRSEGVSDTTDDLNSMEESFTSTSEQAGDTSENLEGFTANIQGALSAAVAGLAVASAGLASQIPIIGELTAGLGAIFSAVGLQIDQLLRDLGVGGLTGGLFTVAGAISQADGAAGDLIGILGGLITLVTGAAGAVASWSVATNGLVGTLGLAKSAIIAGTKAAAQFALGIAAVPAAFAALGAAVFGFFAAYALGIGDIRSKTDAFANGVETKFESLLRNIRQTLLGIKDGIKKEFSTAIGVINTAVDTLNDSIVSSLDDAESDLRSFLLGVRETLLSVKDDIVGFFSGIGSTIRDSLPDISLGDGGGLDFNLGDDNTDSAGDTGSATGTTAAPTERGGFASQFAIDGQSLIESTGRQRRDPTVRNGGI